MQHDDERRVFRWSVSSDTDPPAPPRPELIAAVTDAGALVLDHVRAAKEQAEVLDDALRRLRDGGTTIEGVVARTHLDAALVENVFGGGDTLAFLVQTVVRLAD